MANVGFHLHSQPFPYPSTIRLLHIQNPICHFHCGGSISISNHRFLLHSWPLQHVCRSRRWDSNAESYDNKNFNFNRNDEGAVDYDFDDNMEQWYEVLEDYIDSIWILKVFGSFGWMLPPIILSMLLANGLKAFLMALALPLGQSTLTFAFQRMLNRGKNKPKRNTNTKKGRSRARASRKVKLEDATLWARSQGKTKKKKEYQSWVTKSDISANNSDNSVANFGGWDELDTGRQSKIGSSRSPTQKLSGSQTTPTEKSKLSWRSSESDTPLLPRLLVTVFPFLSSWTKFL